jgi:hypothetical protein
MGDWVETVTAEGMTAGEPAEPEEDATHRAMGPNCLSHVVGARWLESAAARKQR